MAEIWVAVGGAASVAIWGAAGEVVLGAISVEDGAAASVAI